MTKEPRYFWINLTEKFIFGKKSMKYFNAYDHSGGDNLLPVVDFESYSAALKEIERLKAELKCVRNIHEENEK